MTSDIINKLKLISDKANAHVPNINFGGCAVMAALVGRELEKLGIEVEGIAPASNPNKARSKVKKSHKYDAHWWENNGVNFDHVALRFKLDGKIYTYDSDKLHRGRYKFGKRLEYKAGCKFGEGFKIIELKKIASTDNDFWNSDFDRKNIGKLRKIVKHYFKEL